MSDLNPAALGAEEDLTTTASERDAAAGPNPDGPVDQEDQADRTGRPATPEA